MRIDPRPLPATLPDLGDLPPLLTRLYAARGVQSVEELDKGLARLIPYQKLKGIDAAVELLVEALLRLEERSPGLPVMPVHDELVTFSPEPLAPLVRATLAECMSFSLPMPDGTYVPIVAEPAEPAPRWWSST